VIPTISISELVRQVSDNVEPKNRYEQRIVINTEAGQAVAAPGIFDYVFGRFNYYLVANVNNPQKIISGRKSVKYREGSEEIVFVIDYKGGCPPGYEAQLAQFFFRTNGPDKAIGDGLGKWLIEFFTTNGRTIDQFYSANDSASRDLSAKAQSEFGLALTITLTIENSKKSETVEIGPIVLTSRLLGSDDEEKVLIKAELEADPQNLLRAMLNQKSSLTDVFKKGVKQYLASRVTLETYYKELNSGRVKQGLQEHLNSLLKQFGHRVAFVSLKPDGGAEPPPPHNGETTIEYKHHECTEPIKLKISVLMTPQNATRYRAEGSKPLPRWLQENLQEVVKNVLFGFSYVDLLLDFRPAKQKIIEEMNRRAESIGYKIDQLMTMLSMEPLVWRKGFDIDIKNTPDNPNGAMFETSVSGVYVGLEVHLTARVKDLRAVARYLTSDLPLKVKEEVFRLVQKTLHATDPEHFYKYFREGDKRKRSSGGPFEHAIQEKICYLLESEFNAEIIQLVLKPTETDLTIKVWEVAKSSHDFVATSEIGATPGAPKISVHGSFTIEGVSSDGWEKFRERDVTAEKLTKRVRDSVTSFIKRTPESAGALSSQEAVVELIKHALQSAKVLIDDEFGLSIKLATISWEWDESLINIAKIRNEEDLEAIQARVIKLKARLLDQYEYNDSQDAIDETRASIARLTAMVPASLASSVGYRELPEPPSMKKLNAAEVDPQQPSQGQRS
jgi:hypothetical protein